MTYNTTTTQRTPMTDRGNVSLRASLENEIQRTERLNKQRARGGFLSIGFIRDTLTIEKIKEQLKEVPAPLEYLGLEKNNLPHLIRDQALKLYTILLLLNESQRIKGLMRRNPPINDDFLFRSFGKRYASQPCSLERLQGVTELSDIARDFYEKQWIIPPSLLSHETRIFDTQHFRFPFASVPQRLGSGTYGEVYAVKLPKGYLEPFGGTSSVGDTDTVSNQNTSIAYKRIRRENMSDKEWSQTKREVHVLRARRGEHITPLLGSFFAGMHDTSNAEHQCLYLLSPEAKMDMKTWMETPEKNWSPEDIREHIYCEAMPGLISGLTWIHREMDHQVGYHRDIKPSNILLFENDEKERVWKICDFGSSNIKEVDYTGTTNRITSWEWAPPEFFTDDDTKDGFKHGRTHDVYSMGCVFLCLATILRFGWNAEGLSQFKKNRIIIQDDYVDPKDMSYAHSFHKSEKATQEWIKHLQDKRRDDVDSEVLELIVEMLLPKHERIFSWEVEIDLFIILNPDNHPEEVTERLRKIVQKSMGTNLRTHNPFVRAQQRAHLEEKPPKKRSPEYFEVLAENGWQEYVPQSTTDGRQSAEPVQNPLSNFSPSEHRVGNIYGGQSLYRSISAGFAKSDTVVLYGLAGIGKTCNAAEYAIQFSHPKYTNRTKHTFTVKATSKEDLEDSYGRIAQLIDMAHSTARTEKKVSFGARTDTVKTWLEHKTNGGWFLLVDGLDSHQNAEDIRMMLPTPRKGYDQMLITTRNRHVVVELYPSLSNACVEVNALDFDNSHRLFLSQIDRSLIRYDVPETEEGSPIRMDPGTHRLLSTLWSPLLIKKAAAYMNKNQTPVAAMNDLIDHTGLTRIRGFYPGYLAYVLRPLTNTLDEPGSWPRELMFLFLLAFFDSKGVRSDILWMAYEGDEREKLHDLSSRLKDLSLIDKVGRDGYEIYVIKGNIRVAVLEWIKNFQDHTGGPQGLLPRYNKTLSTIYRYYRSKKIKKMAQDGTFESHHEKLALMPHFECFLSFIGEKPQGSTQTLDREAVQAITYFSYALLDQDRHTEAMKAMEYARKRFLTNHEAENKLDKEKLKLIRVRFWLGRQLAKVYLSRPEDHKSFSHWRQAQQLLMSLKAEAKRIIKEAPKWDEYMVVWYLRLDLVRVYWKQNQCSEARKMLERIRKSTGIIIQSIHLVQHLIDGEEIREWLKPRPDEAPEDEQARLSGFHKLLIQLTREYGMLNIAEGMELRPSQTQSCKWIEAKKEFQLAAAAARQWFPEDTALHSDISAEIAVADTKIGRQDLIESAIGVLVGRVANLRGTYGECGRTWKEERNLIAARLKSTKRINIKMATDRAAELLAKSEQPDWKEKLATKECVKYRYEGLIKLGRLAEAQDLRENWKQHDLPPLPERMALIWSLTCILLAMPFFAGCWYYTFHI